MIKFVGWTKSFDDMKKYLYLCGIGIFFMCAGISDLYGQARLLRRMQDEMEKRIVEEVFGKEDENKAGEGPGNASSTRNRRGSGLEQSIPDVNLHIGEARNSYVAGNYSSTKSALRQALWGLELEIGQEVLASLPETVSGLNVEKENDRVSSSGIMFAGLVIERRYANNDDVQLNLSIGNDSGLLGIARIAAASGMYVNDTDQPNQKQIRFQDHQAFIRYDEYEGYTLSVPFGQSSIFLLQGVNFDNESQFMSAAGQFSIQTIKQKLGEQ